MAIEDDLYTLPLLTPEACARVVEELDRCREHCKAKGGVGWKNCSLGSGVSRGSAPRLTPLPWLQFFLPTPTFALQCYRLISTIQLQGSGSVGKLPPAMRDSETVLKLTLCSIVLMSLPSLIVKVLNLVVEA